MLVSNETSRFVLVISIMASINSIASTSLKWRRQTRTSQKRTGGKEKQKQRKWDREELIPSEKELGPNGQQNIPISFL